MNEPATDVDPREVERQRMIAQRTLEAVDAGMSYEDAERWAESGDDVGRLRGLVRAKCPAELLARILL